jgi:2'-5' RNA ligase
LKAKEFTVECGRPDSITEDKLSALKSLGVTRISINPQTFNQSVLENIGRRHSVDEIYKAAPECFAERLRTDTLHMTLHDLSNSPLLEVITAEMERNLEEVKNRLSGFTKRIIRMKTSFIFNMVNTSLVIGLVPADEGEFDKMMELHGIVDEVKRAEYPLTPHITLGYYNIHGFDETSAKRLEAVVGRLNRREAMEIVLNTDKLFYQRFSSMNSYDNVLCLGEK